MSLKDFALLCIIVVGVILFLYGSNSYDAVMGWAGVYFIIGGIIIEIILKVYESVTKRKS